MSLKKSENRFTLSNFALTTMAKLATITVVYQSLNKTSLSIYKAKKNIYKMSELKITYFC